MRSVMCEGGDFGSLPRRRVGVKERGRHEAGIRDGLHRTERISFRLAPRRKRITSSAKRSMREEESVQPINLNEFAIPDDSGRPALQSIVDNSIASADESVIVYFRNLERELIRRIRKARLVVGCVAWLTSDTILQALSEVPRGVSIVVQKEDFLRPDLGSRSGWKTGLRKQYEALK